MAGHRAFWRSLGFVTVGNSKWMAYADDVSHPTRQHNVENVGYKYLEPSIKEADVPRIIKRVTSIL